MNSTLFYKSAIASLTELANLESEFFKARAYRNAISSIKDYVSKTSPEDFYNLSEYFNLKAIGTGISSKLNELKLTGSIAKLIELRNLNPEKLNEKLYKVRKGYITKRISIELALSYYNQLKSYGVKMQYAGSLRRKSELIGDIDILVSSENYDNLVDKLTKDNYDIISSGDYKTSIMIDKVNNTQVDIISVTREDYPFQLLYLTGSQMFSVRLRGIAKSMGYKLNQYGIYSLATGEPVQGISSEEDIFKFLKVNYVKPEDR